MPGVDALRMQSALQWDGLRFERGAPSAVIKFCISAHVSLAVGREQNNVPVLVGFVFQHMHPAAIELWVGHDADDTGTDGCSFQLAVHGWVVQLRGVSHLREY